MLARISRELAQQIVDTVKSVCGQDINFIGSSGIVIASTDEERIGTYHEIGYQVARTKTVMEIESSDGFQGTKPGINLPVIHDRTLLAVIGISGSPNAVRKYADLAVRITSLLIREVELREFSRTQSEKQHFIIETLIHHPEQHDGMIYDLLRDFSVDLNAPKRLVLIRTGKNFSPLLHQATSPVTDLFETIGIPLSSFDYPFEYIGIMDATHYEQKVSYFRDFSSRYQGKYKVAIGKQSLISSIASSYETASIAMESIASGDKHFVLFDDLTLTLILSSVNSSIQKEYLGKTISALSTKELQTLKLYYENDMSLSKTCEQLYIHKNTLQYQLNQIYQKCNLNPRTFRDAVLLYLGIVIKGNHAGTGE